MPLSADAYGCYGLNDYTSYRVAVSTGAVDCRLAVTGTWRRDAVGGERLRAGDDGAGRLRAVSGRLLAREPSGRSRPARRPRRRLAARRRIRFVVRARRRRLRDGHTANRGRGRRTGVHGVHQACC